jgi:hypothetical protein
MKKEENVNSVPQKTGDIKFTSNTSSAKFCFVLATTLSRNGMSKTSKIVFQK